jgi:hypothetical protein
VSAGLICILLFWWPTISLVVEPPAVETFSELYIQGPNHTFDDIPYKIKAGVQYSLYLGISNHLGYAGYYTCDVKFGSEDDAVPEIALGMPSPLPTLYKYQCIIQNGEDWEAPLTFAVGEPAFINGESHLSQIRINGKDFQINEAAMWNQNKTGYLYGLTIELWLFNSTLGNSQFNDRFVHLTLNISE